MAAPYSRNSLVCPISEDFTLQPGGTGADDLDRSAGSEFDITGAQRLLIHVIPAAGSAAAGVDAVQYSFDGGYEWQDADDIRAIDAADDSTAASGGVLNSAGADPDAWFKGGPYVGPVQVRVIADTDWTTDSPKITANVIGLGRDALTAES